MRLLVLAALCLSVGGGTDEMATVASGASTAISTLEAAPVVWIPGGWFWRGSDPDAILRARDLCLEDHGPLLVHRCAGPEMFAVETPRARVWVSEFGIDRTEVSRSAYRRCSEAFVCDPSRVSSVDVRIAAPNQPVAGVTWRDAYRYCRFVGGRLPTEAEWERAARGHDTRDFPWGVVPDGRRANHGLVAGGPSEHDDGYRYAAPTAAFASGVSPWGLFDVAGNVWEWTSDRWDPDAYRATRRVDPRGPETGGQRVIRGGSWRSPRFQLRVTHRRPMHESGAEPDLGFRCAYEPG